MKNQKTKMETVEVVVVLFVTNLAFVNGKMLSTFQEMTGSVKGTVIQHIEGVSSIQCGRSCLQSSSCDGFQFNAAQNGNCLMIKSTESPETTFYANGQNIVMVKDFCKCTNGGSCSATFGGFPCICPQGFNGTKCEINIDDCQSNPCGLPGNGGVCIDGVNSYTCSCVSGYTGTQCETEIDECSSSPCQYGGNCTDGVNNYTCSCVPGSTGINCETNIDECDSNPCGNNGTCNDELFSYTCACTATFEGTHCETPTACLSDPCPNGATCFGSSNFYHCNCPPGKGGLLCVETLPYTPTWPHSAPGGAAPAVYFDFHNNDGMNFYRGATHSLGKINSGMKTNMASMQYVRTPEIFGSGSGKTCFGTPDTCIGGATMAIWLKLNECSGSAAGIMGNAKASDSTGLNVICNKNTPAKSKIQIYTNTQEVDYDWHNIPGGWSTWYHMVIVLHGVAADPVFSVYYNGVLEGTPDHYARTSSQTSSQLEIGKRAFGHNDFYSSVEADELAFWERGLSAGDVTNLYNVY